MEKPEHIRNMAMACKGLPLGPRAVLAEVLAMCENGGRGRFDANNAFLEKKLGLTQPKVSAHLNLLKRCGLLEFGGGYSGKSRYITPSVPLAESYRNGMKSDAEAMALLVAGAYQSEKALRPQKPAISYQNGMIEPNENHTETVLKSYRNDNDNHTESVSKSYRNGNHNRTTKEKGETEDENPCSSCQLKKNELADLQKKIDELEGKLKTARELYKANQRTIADLQVENETLKANATAAPQAAAKKPGRPKKEAAEVCPVHNEAIKEFEAAFLQRNKIPYRFQAKDAKALQGILQHLKKIAPDNEWETALGLFTTVLAGWDKLGKWYADKFNITFINSQINEILSIISGKINPIKRGGINIDDI